MKNVLLDNETLSKYFDPLSKLDNHIKKALIVKLTESLSFEEELGSEATLYGKWEDSRSADDIIKDIKDARFEKGDIDF